MQETERKFLLDRIPPGLEENQSSRITQGYLAIDERVEVRLRRRDDERLLAAKQGTGETREEVEIALDPSEFDELWSLTESRRLAKRRFVVPLEDGNRAEVDVYDGDLEGLVVVEVEFASEADSRRFRPPAWFGAELTGDHRYANRELARHGRPAAAMTNQAVENGAAMRRNGHDGPADRAYQLKSKESPSAGMSRIVNGRIDRAAERLSEARVVEDPTSCVHGARKDLKKLRSALRLLRYELGEERYRVENSAYRDAGRLLSHSRDAEVKVETVEDIRERCRGTLPPGATDEWAAALREERDFAVESTRNGGSAALGEALELVEKSRERVDSWRLEEESWELVGPGIERAYRRGRKRMRRAAAEPSAANVHGWRKRVKDLWYQLRILEDVTPKSLSGRIDVADRLADALGDHHDLAVLRDDLLTRDLPTVKRATMVEAIEQRQEELAEVAFDLGERLYREKPKRFRKKMRRGWRDRRN